MHIASVRAGEPGVVYIATLKCSCGACGADRFDGTAPAIIRVHSSQPHRRRGKPISKRASWAATHPLLCLVCERRLAFSETSRGEPRRFVQMELRDDSFYDTLGIP
ncbi:MAG: hypothetical protein WC986_14800 [Elusimicrobiota bacterium]|jgi:hypothetical protein